MEKLFEKKGKVEIDWKCMHPNKNLPGNVRVKQTNVMTDEPIKRFVKVFPSICRNFHADMFPQIKLNKDVLVDPYPMVYLS
jgi:hypothetical protein